MGLFHKDTEEEKLAKQKAHIGDRLIRAAGEGDVATMKQCLVSGPTAASVHSSQDC